MDLFLADDTKQRKPTRPGMRPLVAVGGLHVPSDSVRTLENGLDELCREAGFPANQEFKWSPGKKTWMHRFLQGDDRHGFFVSALEMAQEAGATAIVVIEDQKANPALSSSENAEQDAVRLFLERAENHLEGTRTDAIVVADRPGGGAKEEKRFLADCLKTLRTGTDYVVPARLALVLTTDSGLARLLQLADLVTGSTLSYVSGEPTYAPRLFPFVKPLIREEGGRIGGCGIKIHPDFRYVNLYHWLLGDEHFWRGSVGTPLPIKGRSYETSPVDP